MNQHSGQGSPDYGKSMVGQAVWVTEVAWYCQAGFRHLIMSGVFEKFPKLKYVSIGDGDEKTNLEKLKKDNVHILRFDQLYPFPYEVLKEEVLQFPNAEIFWVQEEPSNMGAFRFVKHRIESVLQGITGKYKELLFIGRKASASPATGIANRHAENQANIIKLAVESDINEIKKHKDGVTLVKFKLPIE